MKFYAIQNTKKNNFQSLTKNSRIYEVKNLKYTLTKRRFLDTQTTNKSKRRAKRLKWISANAKSLKSFKKLISSMTLYSTVPSHKSYLIRNVVSDKKLSNCTVEKPASHLNGTSMHHDMMYVMLMLKRVYLH